MQKQGGNKYLSLPAGGPLISGYKQRARLEVALLAEEREHADRRSVALHQRYQERRKFIFAPRLELD